VLAQLDGTLTATEARERTASTTRRFVRRQRSWFRRDTAVRWLDAGRTDLVAAAEAQLRARTIEP
jgi:tRNA dimethylallyltransferase